MSAESISSEPNTGLVPVAWQAAPDTPAAALEDVETRLRRANAELELLYAVEQQIASAHALPALLAAVLERVQVLLRFEMAAALIVHESGAELCAVHRGGPLAVRALDAKEAQRLLCRARIAIQRTRDAGGAVADVLVDPPDGIVNETCSVPLSDGSTQIGILQLINALDRADDQSTALRRLGLTAAQIGRAIVLRREREAVERAERLGLLGHSVGAMLHDMRTPLMAVAGCVDLMATEESPELRADSAARAGRALDHMERMAREVLAFARGQREVLLRKVQLPRFVEEVREMLAPEVARSSAALEVQLEYTGSARFDETKLKRVLWNLASNACQAGADKFVWRIARSGEYLVFECIDSGPGIPKAVQGRLFESFATHGTAEGTGLGLAMTKKIIDAHCGRIQMNSALGHGTVFRIEIPI
jgi:signal transduction histidine kinase